MNRSGQHQAWIHIEPEIAHFLENEARRHPKWADVQNRYGLLELSRGNVKVASEIFAGALEINAEYAWAGVNCSQALALAGDVERARTVLQECESPGTGITDFVLAFVEFMDGRYQEAERALDGAPESVRERPDFVRLRAACRYAVDPAAGEVSWQTIADEFYGLDPLTVVPWDESGDVHARCLSFIPGMHQLWIMISSLLGRQGRNKDAERAAMTSFAYLSDRATLLNQKGQLASFRCESDGAVRLWEEAAWLAPDCPNPHINLAYHWSAQGDLDSAFHSLSAALARAPRYADLLYQMGLLLQARGEHEQALKSFRLALERNPFYTVARLQEAEMLFMLDRWDEALASYRKVMDTGLGSFDIYMKLGLCEEHLGNMAQAETAYKEVVRLNPEEPAVFDRLGSILNFQGRAAEAQLAWRRFLELTDDTVRSEEVATLLRAIQKAS